jgi:hypothetical protein
MRLAAGIVIALVVLSGLGYWSSRSQPQQPLQPAALSKYEAQFIELDRAAIIAAYKEQIQHLFLTWAKDDREQPKRASTGARRARIMFENAMAAIDEREQRWRDQSGR